MDPHEEKEKEATLPTNNTADASDSGTCTVSAPTGTAPEELAEEAPREGPGEGPGEAEGPLQGQELPVDKDEEPAETAVRELRVDKDEQPADTTTAAVKKPKSMSGR